MRRRRRRNGPLKVRVGRRKWTYKGLVKTYGRRRAKRLWRQKPKYHGKGRHVVNRRYFRKRRRKSSRWAKLVKKYGVKGAKKRYSKRRR